jgi:hypothetical protein
MTYASYTRATSEWIAPTVLGISGILSLNPYLFWYTADHLIVAGIATACSGAFLLATGRSVFPKRAELIGVAVLTIFVVYITALPKIGGGHVKWVFVLPTLWTLAIMPFDMRMRTLRVFAALFAISVIPSVLLSLYLISGAPITLGTMPLANIEMAMGGQNRYFLLPCALLLEGNQIVLPWGGVLSRICGIYEDAGTVGTVGGLLLAAFRFNLRDWRAAIFYCAGLLSFSLAFVVIAVIGFVAMTVITKRARPIIAAIPVLFVGALALGFVNVAAPVGTKTNVSVETNSQPPQAMVAQGFNLRTPGWNSRFNPSMLMLIDEYKASGVSVWLFGLASDASVVKGSVSSAWSRIYTDYGLIGLFLLGAGLGLTGLGALQSTRYSLPAGLFLLLFCLSIYQRPAVWMPYALLLLFCGSLLRTKTIHHEANSGISECPRAGCPEYNVERNARDRISRRDKAH